MLKERSAPAAGEVREVLLFIADISGYTRYMKANWESLAHSHTILSILLETILERVEGFAEVSKLEGDAVFCFRVRGGRDQSAAGVFLDLIDAFRAKTVELVHSRYCACEACLGIEDLRLKVIAHCGQALFHRVGRFDELAGLDVILLHRLLKNQAQGDEYVLVTEPALAEVAFEDGIACVECREELDAGPMRTFVYYPRGVPWPERRERYRAEGLPGRIADRFRWTIRIWFEELAIRLGLVRSRGEPPSPMPPRSEGVLSGLVLLVTTPLALPMTLVRNAWDVLAGYSDADPRQENDR